MVMSSIAARLVLPFGIFIVLGCAARTPLDDLEPGERQPLAGGSPTLGGQPGGGGGIIVGGGGVWDSGGIVGGGGTRNSGGTTASGGTIASGGVHTYFDGGGGGSRAGGSMGGSPPSGRSGGAGGGAGAQGGSGGRAGAGGVGPMGGNAGAGGVRSSGGTTGSGGSGGCPALAPNEDLIDDLNDGDRYILAGKGRFGEWKLYTDGTPGGVLTPNPFTSTNTGDACRKYAAYIKGYGFTNTGVNLSFGLGSPYDASKYTGIGFWARIDNGTKDRIRVVFPDKDTHPDGGICSGVSGTTGCYNHFGFYATFTTEWTRYYISFSQLTQEPGWGLQAKAFDPATIYEVIFAIPQNAVFGLWIDDVTFTYAADLY